MTRYRSVSWLDPQGEVRPAPAPGAIEAQPTRGGPSVADDLTAVPRADGPVMSGGHPRSPSPRDVARRVRRVGWHACCMARGEGRDGPYRDKGMEGTPWAQRLYPPTTSPSG